MRRSFHSAGEPFRPKGMQDPLAVALSLREYGECFPGLERYEQGDLEPSADAAKREAGR